MVAQTSSAYNAIVLYVEVCWSVVSLVVKLVNMFACPVNMRVILIYRITAV